MWLTVAKKEILLVRLQASVFKLLIGTASQMGAKDNVTILMAKMY